MNISWQEMKILFKFSRSLTNYNRRSEGKIPQVVTFIYHEHLLARDEDTF